jgi:DNA-binding CsgD family transcriptional regulator
MTSQTPRRRAVLSGSAYPARTARHRPGARHQGALPDGRGSRPQRQLAALDPRRGRGESGFLLKDTPPGDLLTAIHVVAGGDALLAPTVTRRLIGEFARRPEPPPPHTLGKVTEREREVLTLIGRGLSNTEIAEGLHISIATARTHVGHLLTKLQARDRAQLVIAAYETGLITARPHHR